MNIKSIIIGGVAAIIVSPVLASSPDTTESFYASRDFNISREGDVHISSFVFNDIENDANYGLNDRPVADIRVSLTSEDGNVIYVPTNIDGFANFVASSNVEYAQIKLPGTYLFKVLPPKGWRVTTGNAEQKIEIVDKVGSPGGLVANPVPSLVGIIQDGTNISANFSPYPVIKGNGKLSKIPSKVTKIDFEDVIKSIRIKKMPNGYYGLNWQNWVVAHQRFYKSEGYINGTTSGEFIAYNGSGHPMTVYRDKPFDFIGGNFTSAWREAEGEVLHVKAWRGEELVYQDDVKLSRLGPVFFQANYDQVTKVEFETDHYWQVVTDDLLFSLD
jgi:hypothetical protein